MTDAAPIFVFGSNLAGRHGRGAALFALQQRGAVQGRAYGRQGQSYAIPTKTGGPVRLLQIEKIAFFVTRFLAYAAAHPELTFELTPLVYGRVGHRPEDIAPLFKGVTPNVLIPPAFAPFLSETS